MQSFRIPECGLLPGLPFQYKLKVGRNGRFTKELWVDRREDSKSLAWSSVKLAFHSLYDAEAETSQENIECNWESMKHTDYTRSDRSGRRALRSEISL